MKRVLAINGSYRKGGNTDQALSLMLNTLTGFGAEVENINLRDYPIQFCLNCRACTQQPGEMPAECVIQDGMQELINKIEEADIYILASPTNFYSVTALFKRFIERLTVYAYWPWNMNSPKFRKEHVHKKKAVLISSCAAPGVLGRCFFNTQKQLNTAAKIIGANSNGVIFTGLVAKDPQHELSVQTQKKIVTIAEKLA